jgi:ubiquinone biosynthesis protein UbiJ
MTDAELEAELAASRPSGLSLKNFSAEQHGQADAFAEAVGRMIDHRLGVTVAPAVAGYVKELRNSVAALEKRVAELEAKPRAELRRVV